MNPIKTAKDLLECLENNWAGDITFHADEYLDLKDIHLSALRELANEVGDLEKRLSDAQTVIETFNNHTFHCQMCGTRVKAVTGEIIR